MDRKMNILIKKKILRSTNYKLLAEIQLNLINNWVFFFEVRDFCYGREL